MIKDGAKDIEIADDNPTVYMKYYKGIDRVRSILTKPRDKNIAPSISIYWGKSGTGKTKQALDENPDAFIVTRPNGNNTLWWDGYTGQKTVIIDEFYNWISYDFVLRLCDRYPLKVQIKGGTVEMEANNFIFTSNKPWTEWWSEDLKAKTDNFAAFRRRIQEFGQVTEFKNLRENYIENEEEDLGFA